MTDLEMIVGNEYTVQELIDAKIGRPLLAPEVVASYYIADTHRAFYLFEKLPDDKYKLFTYFNANITGEYCG